MRVWLKVHFLQRKEYGNPIKPEEVEWVWIDGQEKVKEIDTSKPGKHTVTQKQMMRSQNPQIPQLLQKQLKGSRLLKKQKEVASYPFQCKKYLSSLNEVQGTLNMNY